MSSITYSGINQEIPFDKNSGSLLDISIENQIPHLHECGGHGNCTTCRVRVLEGMPNLSKMTECEKKISHDRRWDPSIRLACQCIPKGPVKLQRLLWESAQVSKLQIETAPEGEAEERNIAILFCDLRNFTTIASQNLTFDMAHMLNRFYTLLGDPIIMNNGIIYQYVGDEIIGVFGTSGGTKQKNCMDAVRAAMGMRHAIQRLNHFEIKDFDTKFNIGIGINYGRAYVGFLGHPTHRQFSVIGDPVNVASRIQDYTKTLKTDVLISSKILDHIPDGALNIGRSVDADLKGKKEKETVVEVLGFENMDIQLELQSSLAIMLKDEDRFADIFYKNVFEKAPFLKNLFTRDMIKQGRLLTHMLGGIVYSLCRPHHLKTGLRALGRSHIRYGVKDEYYPVVQKVMLQTIEEVMEDLYTEKVKQAWEGALDLVISHMRGINNH